MFRVFRHFSVKAEIIGCVVFADVRAENRYAIRGMAQKDDQNVEGNQRYAVETHAVETDLETKKEAITNALI